MNVWTTVSISALLAATAWTRETPPDGHDYVRVCLSRSSNAELVRAEETASEIFARIGVRLDWRRDPRSCAPPNQGVTITLAEQTKPTFHPGELAYALPYEQTTIVVFNDRVKSTGLSPLMAYVLVHEITHILQGTNEHAEDGIMKSRWDGNDYADMRRGRLIFTPRDVALIKNGLKTRFANGLHLP